MYCILVNACEQTAFPPFLLACLEKYKAIVLYYLLGNYNCFQMHIKPFGKKGSDVGISCFEQ